MAKHITVGIDCGTYATRVVVTEENRETGELHVLAAITAPSRGLRHGYITNSDHAVESVRRAVKEAEKAAGVPIKRAVVAIGGISLGSEIGHGTAIISKADNEVTAFDIEKAVKESSDSLSLLNKRVIYMTPIAYRLDGKEVFGRPEGMKGIKLEIKSLFVTCLSQHIEDLEAVLLEVGIEVLDIIPSPIAASAVALTDRQKTVGCALVNIGAETVSIAVFENNMLIGMHVFSIGSTDITNDIALGLKIPLDEAEHMKIGGGVNPSSKRQLENIIEARLSDIFELIENYLKKMKRSGLLPAGIIITGGGAGMSAVEEMSRSLLKLPTSIGSGEMTTVLKTKMRDSTWFVAYGLCTLSKQERVSRHFGSALDLTKKAKSFLGKLFEQFRP